MHKKFWATFCLIFFLMLFLIIDIIHTHIPSLLPCCYVYVRKIKLKNYPLSVLFHYDKISVVFWLMLENMSHTQQFDMNRFILFTFIHKSDTFTTCKYNYILNKNHDGEKTKLDKWYKNEPTNDISSTPLKCWFKCMEEINNRCLTLSIITSAFNVL